jgi:NADP-dependent 3-hydroxy acid dehydrogenase YdfG
VLQPLAERVGVVTGASRGIGFATAVALAEAGMAVVLGARHAPELMAVRDRIRQAGGLAEAIVTDLRDPDQVTALVDGAVERYGRLDALVNNAAVGHLRTIAEGRLDEWRAVLETNLLGTLVACRAALGHMLPSGRGDIVMMGSAAAGEPWPYLAAYAASKAAIVALARSLRAEVAARGVRVMTVEIHNVAGTGFGDSFDPELLPAALQRWTELGVLNPQAPNISPEAVARAVVFQLAQPEPASIHSVVVRSREN